MVSTDDLALFNLVAAHAGLGTGTWARERLLVAARREASEASLAQTVPYEELAQ